MDRIARRHLVIQFDFQRTSQRSYWLVIEPTDVSVCLKQPGFYVDVIVTADIVMFYEVWLGRLSLLDAVRKNLVRLDGTPADLVRLEPHGLVPVPRCRTTLGRHCMAFVLGSSATNF